jgi:acylphosphatase
MERLEAKSRGRVQLVMYRDFVQRKARGLGLVGEVQNLKDGTVKTIAEGSREQLEKLVAKLHTGPLLAHVEGVEITFLSALGTYTTFTIRYE